MNSGRIAASLATFEMSRPHFKFRSPPWDHPLAAIVRYGPPVYTLTVDGEEVAQAERGFVARGRRYPEVEHYFFEESHDQKS